VTTETALSFVTEEITPEDRAGVAAAVRAAYEARQAIYPLGGRTSLDYGIAPTREGQGLDLAGLNKIVDYTPRDMTIVVEAGMRMADLAATLAAERQQLPIEVPAAAAATIGGVCATNWSGPRRYGYGTLRDYVIGIHAVDGRGVAFKGGGRVVKNVAGYDFCKLLTGSLGTLGVITQLVLKLKPLPEQSAIVVASCPDLATADAILSRLVHLPAPPVAIDLLIGSAWHAEAIPSGNGLRLSTIAVRVEGTEAEVASLAESVQYELWTGGGADVRVLEAAEAATLWSHQIEFAARGATGTDDNAALVLKIAVPPSALATVVAELRTFDPACTVQAHAGNGVLVVRFAEFAAADLSTKLVGRLRPAAIQRGGSTVVVSTNLDGLTPHMVWGPRTEAIALMERIKKQFDPHEILNPGRFVF
jgi:glycolate dehydrogenase FAD-binding subunit